MYESGKPSNLPAWEVVVTGVVVAVAEEVVEVEGEEEWVDALAVRVGGGTSFCHNLYNHAQVGSDW